MTQQAWGGGHTWTTEIVTDALLNRVEGNGLHLKQRGDRLMQLVDATNAGQYELVVINGAGTVERTATAGQLGPVGVTLGPMTAGGATEFVRWEGIAEAKIISAVAAGDPVRASATAGRLESCSAGDSGIVGRALTAGALAGDIIEVLLVGAANGALLGSNHPIWDPHGLAVVPVLTDFTIQSHIGGSDSVTQEADRIIIHLAGSLSGNEQGIFLALPTIPFIADACIIPYLPPEYQFSIVLLENGSDKRSQMRSYWDSSAGFWKLVDAKYTNYNTFSASGTSKSYGGPTQPIWMQVNMASGNRTFLFGWNGQDYRTANIDTYTAAGFLPSNPTHIGITVNANGISEPGEIHLVHWHTH